MREPDIHILPVDNIHVRVVAERATMMHMGEHFSRHPKGYMFQPQYRSGMWDGKIRFLHVATGLIYAGLIRDILEFCKESGYRVEVDPSVMSLFQYKVDMAYFNELKLSAHGEEIAFRDYQIKTIETALKQKRRLIQSPTSSGKSSMIYGITRYLLDNELEEGERVLVIVPTISLVNQLRADFRDYSTLNGFDVDGMMACSTDKKVDDSRPILVSTWQSIFRKDRDWFDQFRCLIVDEAHQAKANSLVGIAKKCNAEFRFGFSGSIDSDDETTEMTLRGMFGFKYVATTTKQLMDEGTVSTAHVEVHLLKHGFGGGRFIDYQQEQDYLVSHPDRNAFISRLAASQEGNVLVLFSLVEKHGKPLLELLKASGRDVFFVYGGVKGDAREEIRQIVEHHSNAIILASYQTFSTGINIRSIRHIIFAASTKSFTRVVQSIGRGLRKSEKKDKCTIHDVADEVYGDKQNPSSYNYTFRHLLERLNIYTKEGFDHVIEKRNLGEGSVQDIDG